MINRKGCEALKETINSQVYLYELKNNKLPGSVDDLVKGGFIKEEQTKCKDNLSIILKDGQAQIK